MYVISPVHFRYQTVRERERARDQSFLHESEWHCAAMNQTWIGVSNDDRVGTRFDQNNFVLPADLFLNDSFNDVSNDINLIYQSFFSSSTIVSDSAKNSSRLNRTDSSRKFEATGVATPVGKLILTFLMSTMAFLTVAGNFLVILAFICEPTIRTYSNYFILNLSIADLLIGLIW